MAVLPDLEDLGVFLLVNPQGIETQAYVDGLVAALTGIYKYSKTNV